MSALCGRGCGRPASVSVTDATGDRARVCTACHAEILAAPPGKPLALVHRPARRSRPRRSR